MNSPTRPERGFTLIELLVVIAIIGVLSAIVLVSLNSARGKGVDAAIKSNLSRSRAQAELFYDSNNESYNRGTAATNVCDSAGNVGGVKGVYSFYAAAAGDSGVTPYVGNLASGVSRPAVCHANATGWAALVRLKTDTTQAFCVDSRGFSSQVAITALAAGDVTCN